MDDSEAEIRFGGLPGGGAIPGQGIQDLPKNDAEYKERYADSLRRFTRASVLNGKLARLRTTSEGRKRYGDPNRAVTLPKLRGCIHCFTADHLSACLSRIAKEHLPRTWR